MNRRLEAMWQRCFEARFLELMENGASEDHAIDLAERYAGEQLDRYCDDRLEERKLGE